MNRFERFIYKLFAFFPTRLPANDAQFHNWAHHICDVYGFEFKPSNQHALASLIMHLGPTTAYKPMRYFSFAVMKSLSNEAAFEAMQKLRDAEKEYHQKVMDRESRGVRPAAQEAHTEQAIN